MGAFFGEFAIFDHEKALGALKSGEAVGDGDDGPAFDKSVEGLLNVSLGFGVHVAGGFVQNKQARVVEDGSGNRDALTFAAGQGVASFSDDGFVTEGHAADEIVGIGGTGGGDDLLEACFGQTVTDVVEKGAVEEERFLLNDANLLAIVGEVEVADIDIVERNLTTADVVEAGDEIDDGAFTGT